MTVLTPLRRPAFRPSLVSGVVEPDQVFLLSETKQYVLVGAAYRALAPLLDGSRDREQVLSEASHHVGFADAVFALDQLTSRGYLVDLEGAGSDPETAAWWDALGARPAEALARRSDTTVALEAVGEAQAGGLAGVLTSAGLVVATEAGQEAAFRVVLTDDYLRSGLAEIDARQREAGQPWLLAKPTGAVVWLGPVFVPGQTACWHCLAPRLDGNRQVEKYVGRRTGAVEPIVTARAVADAPTGYGMGAVAVAAEQWIATGQPPQALLGMLRTHDLLSWEASTHTVVRRPQCPACGDAALRDPDRLPPEIRLGSVPKLFTADGGHRNRRPEETFRRLAHHVSPLTGVISVLDRLTEADADLVHSYNAGHNFAMITDDLFFLRRNMRGQSGGKGMTEAQAKTSAVCEAVERWAGVWRGDEPHRRAPWTEVAHEAVHPRNLLGFSDHQYATRSDWNGAQPDSRHHLVPEPLPEHLPVDWTWAWSLTNSCRRRVPAAYVYFGHDDLRRHFFCASDANGCAAGNTLEEAILQGALEVIERDATAIWWYNRIRRPAVDLDSFGLEYIDRLRTYYRGLGREFWVLDITHDLGVPVYAAVSRRTDRAVEDVVVGLGAHVDPQMGVLRAITEMNQFLPAVTHTRPDGSTEYWFPDTDAHDWWRTATAATEPWVTPDPALSPVRSHELPSLATDDIGRDVRRVVERLAEAGLETLVVDQTRPDVDLAVAKVIVPGARHFWRRLGPGRLYDVPVEMGWLDRPTAEADVNPWSIFF